VIATLEPLVPAVQILGGLGIATSGGGLNAMLQLATHSAVR
jgi:hypothetical protein